MVTIYQFGQSAGDQFYFESPRDYMLAIASLIRVNNLTQTNNQLGPYLAGLLEGDGHIFF
jgi:hypothetical protein